MKTVKIIDAKKVTECSLKAAGLYNKVFWGNKRLQIAQSFMRLSILILFFCISFSVFGQSYLGKTFNVTIKQLGAPRDDGTKNGLFYIYYYSGDEGLHVYYFKKDTCIQEEIISSYSRWETYRTKFTGLEKKYDIQVISLKDKFTITIKSLQ